MGDLGRWGVGDLGIIRGGGVGDLGIVRGGGVGGLGRWGCGGPGRRNVRQTRPSCYKGIAFRTRTP